MATLDNSQSITALYAAALGRAPDKAGLEYWKAQMAAGATFADVITGFLSSAEAVAFVGLGVNDQTFVSNLYGNALGRTPDVGGGEYWKGRLGSLESRAELVKEFISSLNNGTGSDTKLLQNKIEIGEKFAASASGSNLIYAKSMFTYVTSETSALDFAKSLNEAFDNPSSPNGPAVPPVTLPTLTAPTIELHADTGFSALDGITNNGTIDVGLPAVGALSWEYSIDAGLHWTTGSGSTFVLPEGTYATGDVLAKYSDGAGGKSFNASFTGSVVIDQTGPAYQSFTTSTITSGPPFFDTAGRLMIDFNEAIYTGTTGFIAFGFTGASSSAGFQNKGVVDGHLTIDANYSLGGASMNLVLQTGIVTDAAGNQSQALGLGAGITFQLV